ncbi:FAST kinase domain-containing protein 3 [Pontoporia blainvillei]|uniref:FAST kinase domain-containing protein 3 n=1 Tax=Pontoporia blainvillei TaxID=48723 RepID=A0ABX0S885_PONBL|nr:FAST kinase domain-containing protein 3 [Pontoporia blainvillei]
MTENTLLLPYTVIRVASVIETLGTKLLKSFINYLPPITEHLPVSIRIDSMSSAPQEYHLTWYKGIHHFIFHADITGEESYLDRLSLAQLTQLFLTAILECPFYKNHFLRCKILRRFYQGPKLLPKYQVKSFLTPCSSLETPMDFQLYKSVMIGLIDLLGARLYFASKVLTPYCYTIDVEIKLDEDGFVLPFTADEDIHKRVALCIDGPKRFCLNSKHLLGKEATKQRHLYLLGYQVVQNGQDDPLKAGSSSVFNV